MSLHEVSFSAKKLWDLRGNIPAQPFASVDPGRVGAVTVHTSIALAASGLIHKPQAVFPLTVPLDTIARSLRTMDVKLLFIENQHVKINMASAIDLVRRAAFLPAYLAGSMDPQDVTVMWVHPSTWQNSLRKLMGLKGRAASGEGKALALKCAEQIFDGDGRFVGANKEQRQGIADAEAIALWAIRTLWLHDQQVPLFRLGTPA